VGGAAVCGKKRVCRPVWGESCGLVAMVVEAVIGAGAGRDMLRGEKAVGAK